jgi:DNA invertase Pin-like site-specific DNA recombinase
MSGLVLDGIVRVSKTGEREHLRSPAQQESDLRRWAKAQGHTIARVHVAIDSSAGKGGHPAIEAAKARALSGEVDGVVAPYLSRFTRNVVYGLETVEQLLAAGRSFFALDCPFDLRTPDGERYLTDKLKDARYEWRVRREQFGRGVAEAIERGVAVVVPYGYRRSDGRASPLAVEEDEAAVVLRAFELRADGWSWSRIAADLNRSGAKPRPHRVKVSDDPVAWETRQASFTFSRVRAMVLESSDTYLGTAHNGQGSLRYEGAHPAIPGLTPELVERARRARGAKPNRSTEGHLLTGLVRTRSGVPMVHSTGPGGRRYYRAKGSGAGNVNAEALERVVEAEFVRRAFDIRLAPVRDGSREAVARERLARAEAQLEGLFDVAGDVKAMSAPERRIYERKLAAAREEITAATEAVAVAQRAEVLSLMPPELSAKTYRRRSLPERRRLLGLLFAVVVVYPGRGDVAGRVRFVGADEVDDGRSLGEVIAGVDPDPPRAGEVVGQ